MDTTADTEIRYDLHEGFHAKLVEHSGRARTIRITGYARHRWPAVASRHSQSVRGSLRANLAPGVGSVIAGG